MYSPTFKPNTCRKIGRPKKRTTAYYREMWVLYCWVSEWFENTQGRPHASVAELLETYFSNMFTEHGMRASRVKDSGIKSKLKTFSNEISIAKTLQRTNPIKA